MPTGRNSCKKSLIYNNLKCYYQHRFKSTTNPRLLMHHWILTIIVALLTCACDAPKNAVATRPEPATKTIDASSSVLASESVQGYETLSVTSATSLRIDCSGTASCRSLIILSSCRDKIRPDSQLEKACTHKSLQELNIAPGESVEVKNLPAGYRECKSNSASMPTLQECAAKSS